MKVPGLYSSPFIIFSLIFQKNCGGGKQKRTVHFGTILGYILINNRCFSCVSNLSDFHEIFTVSQISNSILKSYRQQDDFD